MKILSIFLISLLFSISKSWCQDFQLLSPSSLHLDSTKHQEFQKDSVRYAEYMESARLHIFVSQYKEALFLLDTCYHMANRYKHHDSLLNSWLSESLIIQLQDKNISNNIEIIRNWRNKYPFIKTDIRMSKIWVNEATKLAIAAFDNKNFQESEKYYLLFVEEIEMQNRNKELLDMPNNNILMSNLGLLKYYQKKYSEAEKILKLGHQYFPQDEYIAKYLALCEKRL